MLNIQDINFDKLGGLIPVCVQDYASLQILMVGFMNQEALQCTLDTGFVTFYSRSKNRLWTKGETSDNFLSVVRYSLDCDNDSLLIFAKAAGPTCHTGDISCFTTKDMPSQFWLSKLIEIIEDREKNPQLNSYTTKLFQEGTKRIAQKVGEEGVEVALAAVCGDDEELANEVVDLLFHLFVLLKSKNMDLEKIWDVLRERMKQ